MARPVVSVVVPVHNPGPYIEPCIRSILRQSMPRDRFEAIFVDDGSTDGTGTRLDRLAREHPHVRVIHIQASGAPGRPRNVGLAAAIGEFVQFLDADDELAPRALERLVRMARANQSDIVLGKFASETLSRRQDLFTRPAQATSLAATPQLIDSSLGPTKLFSARLLREAEITFPEGWRQMEDQLFTLRAYAAARVISILGDQPCYYFNRREDEGHISAERVDPATHVAHLREFLDDVDSGLADAGLRGRIRDRLYRTEVLARLAGPSFVDANPAERRALFGALRTLARERFLGVADASLGSISRIRSALLLTGDLRSMVRLAQRVDSFALAARAVSVAWVNGRLAIEFEAALHRADDGHPLTLVVRDGRTWLDPAIAEDLVGPLEIGEELAGVRAQVSVVQADTSLEWLLTAGTILRLKPIGRPAASRRAATLIGLVDLDPERVGPGGHRLENGTWFVLVRWVGLGFHATNQLRLPQPDRGDRALPPAVLGRPAHWVVPRRSREGALRLAVANVERLPADLPLGAARAVEDGRRLVIDLPIATDRLGRLGPAVFRLTGAESFDLSATAGGFAGSVSVASPPVPADAITPGRYALTCHLVDGRAPGLRLGHVLVADDGRLLLVGMARASRAGRIVAWLVWAGRSGSGAGRSLALAGFRRLPGSVKQALRAGYVRRRG